MNSRWVTTLTMMALGGLIAWSPVARAEDTKPAQASPSTGKPQRTRPARGASAQNRLDQMATQLGLSEDQKTKLAPVLKEQAEKMRTLRQDQSLSDEQRREKAKALREEYQPKIKKILTPEQFDKWQKQRAQGARGQRPAGQRRTTGESK